MPKVVDAVRAQVWHNPKRFMMGMACDMNVSDKMMRNTIKTDLKLSSLKMQTCQCLTDLKVMDCCVQSLLEADACASLHELVEALKHSLVTVWAKMPQEILHKVAEGFHSRLNRVIQARGGHIE